MANRFRLTRRLKKNRRNSSDQKGPENIQRRVYSYRSNADFELAGSLPNLAVRLREINMFKNLTERERKLALAVLCLVPLCVIFFALMSFMSSYQANQTAKRNIERQIQEQEDLQSDANLANVRREYYRQFSLPSDLNRSITQYKKYIQALAQKESGLVLKSTREKSKATPVSFVGRKGRTKVFDQVTFTLRGSGRLTQITRFLHKFYSLDMIHRISELSIEPVDPGSAGEGEGLYKLIMNVEVASMVDADKSRDFEETYRPVAKSLADYDRVILYRNMFGPPNNAPTISKAKHSYKPSGDTVSFKISADDIDKNDLLTFELVNCPMEGAQLEQKREGDRYAFFNCGKLAPGDYEFELKVTDSGAPNKSDQKIFTLTIEDNAAPKFTALSKEIEESMADISFKVAAKDSDRGDRLSFEMVSSEIDGATFEQSSERSTYATFECPAQPIGEYKMVFRVTDNATPPKSDEQEFVLTVVESSKARLAPASSIAGIRVRGGVSSLVVHVRPTNEFLETAVGESFELDELEWTVRRIENRIIEIECNGYILVYDLKSDHTMLDSPLTRTKLPTATVNDEGEGEADNPKVSVIESN